MPRHPPLLRHRLSHPPFLTPLLPFLRPHQLPPPCPRRHRQPHHRPFHIIPPITLLMPPMRTHRTLKQQRPHRKMTDAISDRHRRTTGGHAPYRTAHDRLFTRRTHRVGRFYKRVSRTHRDHGFSASFACGVNDGLDLFFFVVCQMERATGVVSKYILGSSFAPLLQGRTCVGTPHTREADSVPTCLAHASKKSRERTRLHTRTDIRLDKLNRPTEIQLELLRCHQRQHRTHLHVALPKSHQQPRPRTKRKKK